MFQTDAYSTNSLNNVYLLHVIKSDGTIMYTLHIWMNEWMNKCLKAYRHTKVI